MYIACIVLIVATFLGGVFGAKLKACATRNSVFNGTYCRSAMAEYTVTILGTDYKIRKWKVLYLIRI